MISDNDEARERAYTWGLIRRETNDELYDIVCKGRRRWTIIFKPEPVCQSSFVPLLQQQKQANKKKLLRAIQEGKKSMTHIGTGRTKKDVTSSPPFYFTAISLGLDWRCG